MDDVGLSTPFNPSIELCAGAQLLFNETKEVQKDQVELMVVMMVMVMVMVVMVMVVMVVMVMMVGEMMLKVLHWT